MESLLRRLAVIWHALLEGIFPRRCVGCQTEGAVWCAACTATFAPTPPEPFLPKEGSALTGATAFFSYANPSVRQILTGWKYIGDEAYAEVIRTWVKDRSVPPADAIVSIPLHSRRQNARGYNQADIITETIAAQAGIPLIRSLERIRHTAPRARVALEKRGANDLAGVFRVTGPVPARVLLVDDVLTTGATLEAAAQALKDAGAVSVWAVVVARGGA